MKPIVNDAGESYIHVYTTKAAEKGKANKAIINLLSEEWGLPKNSIHVARGEASRFKMIKITSHINERFALLQNWVKENN
ncbi:DUF167 domain-containing protein [Temperatibacter marinus]